MDEQILMFRAALTMGVTVVCLFSIIFLGTNNWQKNKWLILIFGVHLLPVFNYMMGSEVYDWVKDSSFLINFSPLLLFFPALYFYTQDLVTPNMITLRQRLPHFIPFLIFYIVIALIGGNSPTSIYRMIDGNYFLAFFVAANTVVLLLYSYYIFRLVSQNQQKYQNTFASSNPF